MPVSPLPKVEEPSDWRRHRVPVFIGAAIVSGLALWAAEMPDIPWPWLDRLPTQPEEQVPIAAAQPEPVIAPPSLPEVPTGTDSSVSETPQPLILSGTMPGRNSQEGMAFIGIDASSPQTYAAGALLANGARVEEIFRDHVVLRRGQQSAKLYLQSIQSKADSNQLSALLKVGGPIAEAPAVSVSYDLLTDYIRPTPVFDGELIKGYQVYPGKRSGVFSQLGLKGGDVILALNDAPFASPDQAIEILNQLTTGTAMVATVERENKWERVSLDGQLVVADQEMQKNAAAAVAQMPIGPPAM